MIPKLRVSLREAVLNSRTSSQGKSRATGYCHTYFDSSGIDPLALSVYPSDPDILEVAAIAFEEADQLFMALGVDAASVRRIQNLRFKESGPTLPCISSWYLSEKEDNLENSNIGDEDDSVASDVQSISSAQELQELVDECDTVKIRMESTREQEKMLLNLSCAAVALHVYDHIKV